MDTSTAASIPKVARKSNTKALPVAKPQAMAVAEMPAKQLTEDGKARRKQCPRSSHAELGPLAENRDVVSLIMASNKDRLENLLPIRHSRMMESPFAFFRGTAVVQAADLARSPASGIKVQACGDCHLLNFGGFATPERDLIFDVNDFDETFPAPWEWDVKRLCTSLVLAARWRGFSSGQAREAVNSTIARYREVMHSLADMPAMEVWYYRVNYSEIRSLVAGDKRLKQTLERGVERAQRHTSEHVYEKLATEKDGTPRIADNPPLLFHPNYDLSSISNEFAKRYIKSLREDYRVLLERFRPVDAAIKVVGIGSVGTRCFVVLLLDQHNHPLFLQVKEARRSVLEDYAGRSPWRSHGERVIAGQRLMQAVSDIFLGWSRAPTGRDFYVRQLRDMKVAAELDLFDASMFVRYGQLCGRVLARAHAKAGQASRIAGYLGSHDVFDEAITKYANAYADQVERDYEVFRAAVRKGKLRTETSASPLETMIA